MPRDPRRVVPFCFRFRSLLAFFRSISFSSREGASGERDPGLDSWVATTNNYWGGRRRRLRTIDRRSRIRPPLFLASWKFLSPGRGRREGGRNTILHLNTPLLYFVPILSIRSGRRRDFFSRFCESVDESWIFLSMDIRWKKIVNHLLR